MAIFTTNDDIKPGEIRASQLPKQFVVTQTIHTTPDIGQEGVKVSYTFDPPDGYNLCFAVIRGRGIDWKRLCEQSIERLASASAEGVDIRHHFILQKRNPARPDPIGQVFIRQEIEGQKSEGSHIHTFSILILNG